MAEKIGIAQVGVGYWGKNLLRNFAALPEAELVMVCDQRPNVLASVFEQYPQAYTTTRYADILESSDIQAVVIATETPLHFEMAEAALLAGKHVFVEKPMAQTVAQAERLVEIAEANDLRLMVGHLLMYHPAFTYVKNLIDTGELGDIYYMYSTRVNLGIIRQRENAFESLAPHDLSIALSFIKSRPVAVSAQGHDYLQRGIADVVFATIFFEDGKLAHIHTSWLDPHKERKMTVVGNKKMAVIDDVSNTEKVRIYDKGVHIKPGQERYADYAEAMTTRSGNIQIPKLQMKEPLRLECQHFIQAIRHNRKPLSDGRNGLSVVRLLSASKESIKKGQSVAIDL